jgi:murein L,D-transpeptidase YafK
MRRPWIHLLFLVVLTGGFGVSATLAKGSVPASPPAFDNGISPRLPDNLVIDSIAIHKADHEMLIFRKGVLLKIYSVQLGLNPVGPKRCNGDYRTPEGLYYINSKNSASKFHKSLGISYPNAVDLQRSAKIGLSPGGDIMIHGLPNGEENVGPDRYQNDWTWGCIAIRNAEVDELFEHTEVGTPLLITP